MISALQHFLPRDTRLAVEFNQIFNHWFCHVVCQNTALQPRSEYRVMLCTYTAVAEPFDAALIELSYGDLINYI